MTGSDRGQTYCITVRFIIFTLHYIYHDGMCGKCSFHERHTDISTKFLVGDLKTREHLRDIYRWGDRIKMNLEELGWKEWAGFILFTTGFGSQQLW